jgi:hypothetical protein
MRGWLGAAVIAVCSLLWAAEASAQQPPTDPVGVLVAFELARNRGDLDAALSYFASDAVVVQRSARFNGRDEIRTFLQAAPNRGRATVIANRRQDGSRVTWNERIGSPNANTGDVNAEAVVLEGKIRSLVYNGILPGQRFDGALDARSQLPATLGLGSVLFVLLGMVGVIASGLGHARRAPSSLQGRLMHDLRGWTETTARSKA